MKYVIGVDGGGTKTEVIAYNSAGEQIACGYGGFANIIEDRQQGLDNIGMAISQCMENLNRSDCVHIYAGISGMEVGNNKEIIENYLTGRFNTSITVINDADLAFYALLKGEDGIITISGTGSVSFGFHKDKYFRAGGWGKILGDEGSGYDIALNGLKKVVSEIDDGLESSDLSKEILSYINVSNIYDMVEFVSNSNKTDIAAITPVIVKAAERNDENAVNILKVASKELANITVKVYKMLGFQSQVNICILGSILTKVSIIKENYIRYLSKEIKDFNIINECISSAKGSYYLAIKNREF
ncbi:N-acetylglucosamine kinase [Inconstantimicrobium mannanitabidum]|uniref:ATPase n=1 Tax=Inconstantimicrobium mannanitabidum TaxID=1604901 RepID=A0ACB5R7S4_9CLOT|nr:BadF/BadG/BcrA/BcrD ATPase family protein [Clostridium sp. TW13]GKX65250.1 ATPase [Clostridium sp. TW13]